MHKIIATKERDKEISHWKNIKLISYRNRGNPDEYAKQ